MKPKIPLHPPDRQTTPCTRPTNPSVSLPIPQIQEQIYEILGERNDQELQSMYEEVSNILSGLSREEKSISEKVNAYIHSDEILEPVQGDLLRQYPQIQRCIEALKKADPSLSLYHHFYEHTLYDVLIDLSPKTIHISRVMLDPKDLDLLKGTGLTAKVSELIWKGKHHLLESIQKAQKIDFYYSNIPALSPEVLRLLSMNMSQTRSISGGNLLDLSAEQRSSFFDSLPPLKHLSIELHDWTKSKSNILSLLDTQNHLRSLNITGVRYLTKTKTRLGFLSSHQANCLRVLGLHSMSEGDFQIQEIDDFFSQMDHLKILVLSQFGYKETSIEYFQAMLTPLKNLQDLSLLGGNLGDLSEEKIKAIFCSLPKLKRIHVSDSAPANGKNLIEANLPEGCCIEYYSI